MKYCNIEPEKLGYERPRKQAYKKNNRVIKVIGISRKDILSLPQYQPQPGKLPVYSSMFERTELPVNAASSSLIQSNLLVSDVSIFGHTKTEGLPVISLNFNPYN